ncbi:ABC transporter substrate-binding protein [Kordiimonas sediminis]|uniref:ABC transporter substrate-binding protein n=1 Tax=Kordiimonas sediminis TaxID=1735581 RepID=A0A919AJ28_9PROT|nr:MlaD family protein [Kordiimonas sediminis]GHF11830.1 ABC transporter substrate-binding protein [Kordiimonas sediminis]
METRASHILVGGFVLALIGGLVAFTIWIAKVDLDAEYSDYDIYFDGTVSGLYKRGTVYYLGIPVGEVRDITLAPNDPRKVRVTVRLNAEVPVNEGAMARLEFQGLTGVAYIEIDGGDPQKPFIQAREDQDFPVIPSETSSLQEVYLQAPNLLKEAIRAVSRISDVLNDENLASVSSTLKNIDSLTANVAKGTEEMDLLVRDLRAALSAVTEAATAVESLAGTGETLLSDEGRRLMAEASETMIAARGLATRLDTLVGNNEEAVTQFVGGTLPEVTRLVMDLRRTARNLSRVVSRIEQNPSEVLFGPDEKPYDPKKRKKEDDS